MASLRRRIKLHLCVSSLLLSFLEIALIGCGGGNAGGGGSNPTPTPTPTLTSISVTPTNPSIAFGSNEQFTATGTYSDGSAKDLTATASWSSSATAVATISSGGLATSVAQGVTTISAASGSATGSTTLTVGPPPPSLTSINVTPATPTIPLGLTQQFAAKGTYSDGSTKDLTSTATWSSSATSVATVSSSGLATSMGQGSSTISAESASVTGTATLTVGPPQLTGITVTPALTTVVQGSSQSFVATGRYTDSSTQNLSSTVSWTISNPYVAQGSVATSPALAFVATPQLNGVAIVSAATGNFSATAKLAVIATPRFALTSDAGGGGESVSRYVVDASTGDLRARGYQSTFYQGDTPFTDCVTTDPSGTFAYVIDPENPNAMPAQTGNVRIYQVNSANGAATEITGSPFPTHTAINCIEFEPSGKFGYALSYWSGENQLRGYSRSAATGALSELNWSPMTVGDTPVGLAIDPFGRYLYFVNTEVTSGKPTSIAGYSIDGTTGDLTPIKGMPLFVANTTTALAIEPLGNYAYVSHGGANTVDAYRIDRGTGILTLISGSTITTDYNPSSLVFSADGTHAYVAAALHTLGVASSGTIAALHIDSTSGQLTSLGTVSAGIDPGALTVDPSGKFVYSSDNYSYLRVNKIQPDGTLKFVRFVASRQGPATIAFVGGASAAALNPSSVLVTTAGDSLTTGYAVQSDGSLQKNSSTGVTPAGPLSLALLPWGSQALVAASGAPSGSNLAAFSVVPTTAAVTYEAFLGDAAVAGGVSLDPSEQYAFQSDSSAGVLRTYARANPWGLVTYSGSSGTYSTFPAGTGAGPMAMLPSGRYLYVANQGANSISAFAFWGELFEMTSAFVLGGGYLDASPYSIGAKPIALAADPMGMYLYVVCDDNTVRVYSIDSAYGGHITRVASVSLTAAPTSITVDATGRFLYVGDAAGNVSPFAVDPATGALTALTPSVLPAAITAISVESSGQFAYVLCAPATGSSANNGSVNAFKVNVDGTLSTLSAGPWLANQPTAIAFTDSVQ